MPFDPADFACPERYLPGFEPGPDDRALWAALREALRDQTDAACDLDRIAALYARSSFPRRFDRLALVLYAHGHARILATRRKEAFAEVFARLLAHPRRKAMTGGDFRLQMDFVLEPPSPVDLFAVGMSRVGELHFEVGVDGLAYRGADGKTNLFLPGDAYVRSVMGMRQLRDYLTGVHGEDYVRAAEFARFRSESYLSSRSPGSPKNDLAPEGGGSGHRPDPGALLSTGDGWTRLYRGYPVVGALTRGKIEHAVELAIRHIRRSQEPSGKFLYYYDAALDSRRDHEHPTRDPDKNPYYNILRHGGGGLTCAYYEKWARRGDTLENIRRAIDYLIATSFRVREYQGREGAYVYSERKSKLGGAGIALYLLSEYQLLTGDDRYRPWADRLAWHLINQVTPSGEFIYYNIYLDREIDEAGNREYFSFYYPGEAVCGLAKYLHLVTPAERADYVGALRRALGFLIDVRPVARAAEYTAVPSDAWLMMGIMELWDFEEMRDPAYAGFVFGDADKMIGNMYKVGDAPCPDYAGAFYYTFGEYPYADGARCEGLLGAYALAEKMGDRARMRELWPALRLAAWAVMHLVNVEDAIYFARNPDLALGGIRFKYTRQWFRIDTIQHVASFFAKLLPYWEGAEAEAEAGAEARVAAEAGR